MINQLKAEATVMQRGLHWRCITSAEAAGWADRWVLKLNEPPADLLEVSLSARSGQADTMSVLAPLTRPAEASELVPETLGMLAQILTRHPERLAQACAALWDLSFAQVLPAEVDEVASSAKWRLEDARDGVYDSVEDVAADVARVLHPYLERFATA